jgi:hypothetical protein
MPIPPLPRSSRSSASSTARRASNFGAALNDYAFARPSADAILVNYGPISEDMRQKILDDHVDDSLHERCHMIGELRPRAPESLDAFRALVRATIEQHVPQLSPVRSRSRRRSRCTGPALRTWICISRSPPPWSMSPSTGTVTPLGTRGDRPTATGPPPP